MVHRLIALGLVLGASVAGAAEPVTPLPGPAPMNRETGLRPRLQFYGVDVVRRADIRARILSDMRMAYPPNSQAAINAMGTATSRIEKPHFTDVPPAPSVTTAGSVQGAKLGDVLDGYGISLGMSSVFVEPSDRDIILTGEMPKNATLDLVVTSLSMLANRKIMVLPESRTFLVTGP